MSSLRRRRILAFGAVLALIGIAAGVPHLGQWQIRKIYVDGTTEVGIREVEEEVRSLISGRYVYLIPRSWTPLVDADFLRERIMEKFWRLGAVSIIKEFPDTLAITLANRVFWGIVCNDAPPFAPSASGTSTPEMEIRCVYIDESGFAYDTAPKNSGVLISVVSTDLADMAPGKNILPKDFIADMEYVRRTLPHTIGSSVRRFFFYGSVPDELRLAVEEGYEIWFRRGEGITAIKRDIAALRALLEKGVGKKRNRLSYIDMRFGNKIFYKTKP
jgi:hypothetical protein